MEKPKFHRGATTALMGGLAMLACVFNAFVHSNQRRQRQPSSCAEPCVGDGLLRSPVVSLVGAGAHHRS